MFHKRHKPFQKLFSIVFLAQIANVISTKPRGVSPDMASLFDSSRDFVCFDESSAVPFDHVNDDYCDCNDGSDEPGTSACPNGSFYCANKGFKAKRLLSSRVNDGVCDCCDGSDEWAKFTSCPNNCQKFSEAEKLAREETAKITKEGLKARNDLVEKSFEIRSKIYFKIDEKKVVRDQAFERSEKLRRMKELAEIPAFKILEEIRSAKKALEDVAFFENEKIAEEKSLKIFDKLDHDQNGVLTKEDIAREIRFDQNNDGIVSNEEVALYLGRRDSIPRDAFFKEGWPLISHLFQPDQNPPSSDYEDYDYDEDEDDEGKPKDNNQSAEARSKSLDDIDQIDVDSLDDDGKKIIEEANEARNAFDAAEKEYLGVEEEIKELENELKVDCGEDDQFLPLVKECFELAVGDYIYKHCLMDYCSQISSNEGSEIRLGNWKQWSGPETERHSQMLYSKGERCWNGPSRSVKVNLVCGVENALKSVSEPSKCEYLFVFETPAICHEVESEETQHEEL